MPYSVKGFFEINEDMVQILLMLEELFTQDSKVEDLFCGASSSYRSLLKHLSWSPRQLAQVLLVYYQLRLTSSFSVMLLHSQLPHGKLVADLLS